MSELFWNAITEEMKFVLNGFSQSEVGRQFYLAGGTALALQLGHRQSVDLDFFSQTLDIPSIRTELEETIAPFDAKLVDSSWGNLVFLVKDVRVGFYGYGYDLVNALIEEQSLRLASAKFPSIRDFEAQVVKRLAFFESADEEMDPSLLQPVSWQTIKDYFTAQAKEFGKSWLQ